MRVSTDKITTYASIIAGLGVLLSQSDAIPKSGTTGLALALLIGGAQIVQGYYTNKN